MQHRTSAFAIVLAACLAGLGCSAGNGDGPGADAAGNPARDAGGDAGAAGSDAGAMAPDVPLVTSDDVPIVPPDDVTALDAVAPSRDAAPDTVAMAGCPPPATMFMYPSDVWFRFANLRVDNSWSVDSGRAFGFVLVDTASGEVLKRDLTTIPMPPTGPVPESGYYVQESDGTPCGASMNHTRSYQIAYFIDRNGNGLCDDAPTDRVWLINVAPSSFRAGFSGFAAHYSLVVSPLTDDLTMNPTTTNPAACRLLNSLVLRDH